MLWSLQHLERHLEGCKLALPCFCPEGAQVASTHSLWSSHVGPASLLGKAASVISSILQGNNVYVMFYHWQFARGFRWVPNKSRKAVVLETHTGCQAWASRLQRLSLRVGLDVHAASGASLEGWSHVLPGQALPLSSAQASQGASNPRSRTSCVEAHSGV